jgi:glycosyltransferase involved in cell wall biosynthesis
MEGTRTSNDVTAKKRARATMSLRSMRDVSDPLRADVQPINCCNGQKKSDVLTLTISVAQPVFMGLSESFTMILMSDAARSERVEGKARVLHVAEAWHGGVGVYLEALIRQQLDDPTVAEVHLVCSRSRCPAKLSFDGHPKLHVHRYESSRSPWGILPAGLAVKRVVRSVRPDLVHLHSTFAGLYGRLFRSDCPVVYCAHGWAFTQDLAAPVRWAYVLVEQLLARRTSALVHISQDELRAAWQYGVRAGADRVILHGVRAPDCSTVRALSIDPTLINLGFVGRFDRQKGTELLFRAFGMVQRDDIRLYLMGDFDREAGRAMPALDDPRIVRLGWVQQQELDGTLARLDAVVVPSRWEGFGLVAAEAMRNGKPVIVSHRGGLPEQVVHGYNGLVFPFERPEVLAELLTGLDKASLAEMGQNARRVWERSFSEGRAYRELMNLYFSLLAS